MISGKSISHLLICATFFISFEAKADDSAKIPDVQTKADVYNAEKPKPINHNSQSYPQQNEDFRNDGRTPSCVSSPELSGSGNRSTALPDFNSK